MSLLLAPLLPPCPVCSSSLPSSTRPPGRKEEEGDASGSDLSVPRAGKKGGGGAKPAAAVGVVEKTRFVVAASVTFVTAGCNFRCALSRVYAIHVHKGKCRSYSLSHLH